MNFCSFNHGKNPAAASGTFATAVEHGVLSEQCKWSNGLLRAVGTGGEDGGYSREYDCEDYDDYYDSETRAARGERDYFSDDPSDDYNSYYAQVADDAMMGDRDAMDEMYGEFGEGEW
ncbi:hypothetical protein SAMN04487775_10759 [Treponema bryantii]|uniref:Uncharacterized protein n=1 Tax=Treponema bryantii TaxID=163 RepID=A0A1I3LM45_9SPIR|nr:hypothetical protein [Treponema bryantii]SFI85546.1 hypothetical protein SAMN04487775_10759 [Treponema bryantii]